MNEILCKITGGHKYKDINQKTFDMLTSVRVENYCVKCGKKYKVDIPYIALFTDEELELLLGTNTDKEQKE